MGCHGMGTVMALMELAPTVPAYLFATPFLPEPIRAGRDPIHRVG
jgi:hypothetical protein